MVVVTMRQAKANLPKLVARAEAGEEIITARRNKPVARIEPIVPSAPLRPRRELAGILKDKVPSLPDSFFFDPLPEEELRLWEGRGDEEGTPR